MAKTARDRVARLFDDVEPAGSFSAQLLAPAHLLELEVCPGSGRCGFRSVRRWRGS
jgi:hypothetical protein